jgi:hypothetical protein
MGNKKSGVALVPATASPVLKTKVNITLEDTFPYALAKADFTVNATNISNPTYFRQMNVIGVHEPTKSLMVMFGGAWSGDYLISIRHKAFGLIDNKDLLFVVGSNVTNVTPNSGSKYGGTMLTITGNNFGTVPTDNPVQISTLGAVGSIDCFVKTITQTQITCRVGKTNKEDGKKGKVITFLKTSEEAKCVPNNTCEYEYKTPSATLQSITTAYSTQDGEWQTTVTGTGFPVADCANTEFLVYGKKQTCKSQTATAAIFTLSNLTNTTIGGMQLYFAEGTPEAAATVLNTTMAITPKFNGIVPNFGSAGGTFVKVEAPGVGLRTVVTLGFANGTKVCNRTIVNATNHFWCLTNSFINTGVNQSAMAVV